MAFWNRKSQDDFADKVADKLLEKATAAALGGTPLMGAGIASATPAAQLHPQLIGLDQPRSMKDLAVAMARDANTFGGALGPAVPFVPQPLDTGWELDGSGRPKPRKSQYDVAINLDITRRLTQWQTLQAASTQIDLFARAITIRCDDVTKMDWSWNVSKSAINTIMEDNHCTYAAAAKIGRQTQMAQIVRLSEAFENPYPQSDRSWEEWITEVMWQVLVYDGLAIHPAYNLGGEVVGLDVIDASTIKILLDNAGDFPRPPDPAYQQILYGFARGEFIATPDKNAPLYFGGEYQLNERDQLSYFVKNRRTITPYGLSPVEQALEMANIYKERQAWMLAEYRFGTMASVYFKNSAGEITLENLSAYNRVINDWLIGSTANRQSTVTLPPTFEPEFAPTNEEKYKSDKDEDLIKRVVAFFGVDPRQFGVVPRAGLGGGKGAAEGEADNTETVSSKPQNKYLERCIQQLARRYYGANNMVSFDLKNDEGSEDEVEVATAGQLFISSGQKTPNEVRGEQGLPLSTLPEADELMIVTATGPVFLTGTLDAQLNPPAPPPPPAPIIMQGGDPAKPEGAPANGDKEDDKGGNAKDSGGAKEGVTEEQPAGSSAPASAGVSKAQLAEIQTFGRFVKTANKRGRFSTFEFASIDDTAAAVLNDAAYFMVKGLRDIPEDFPEWAIETAGLAPRPKSSLTKSARVSNELASHKQLMAAAHSHAGFLRAAIVAGTTGVGAAVTHALADKTGADAKEIARQAVAINVSFDNGKAKEMLGNIYTDAGAIAEHAAAIQTGVDPIASQSIQQLLHQRDIILKGIDDTATGRISNTIAKGLSEGLDYDAIQGAVSSIIDDPSRASVIAITESNRAYNSAFVDQLTAAGETQFEWVTDGDPCPECADLAGIHDIGDDVPPEHPNCECVSEMVSAATAQAA